MTARGNRQQPVFGSFGDHLLFLDLLGRVVEQYRWRCLGYCLMPNHYHLLVVIPTASLSVGIQLLNGRYAQTFNHRYGISGHLFQGRFHAVLVERQHHLLELCRYVVLNPVRGRLCRTPREWPWSSYRATVGIERPPRFLEIQEILGHFGNDQTAATRAFRRFVDDG